MQIIKCDRCGKIIENNSVIDSKNYEIHSKTDSYSNLFDHKLDGLHEIDLCTDCINSARLWWKTVK